MNTDEKTNRYIEKYKYTYIHIKKWWTYVNIYVYTNKKSVVNMIVYYICVLICTYRDIKIPWGYTKIDLFALYGV